MPSQYAMPNINTYGGAYNNYPYRGMTSMNMGGFNPYGAYGQPTNGQYQDRSNKTWFNSPCP